uniref:Uncharacterized protein n=1 Tax=viral metagenome TaxID=1070528 RepID=A0A6M3LTB1_9ZZZZ
MKILKCDLCSEEVELKEGEGCGPAGWAWIKGKDLGPSCFFKFNELAKDMEAAREAAIDKFLGIDVVIIKDNKFYSDESSTN